MTERDPILSVRELSVEFDTAAGPVRALDEVSLDVHRGEVLGVIGESGCGKTTLMLSLVGLLDRPGGHVVSGRALLGGDDLLGLSGRELRGVRGKRVGLVFQDPGAALHPSIPVVAQVAEAFRAHDPGLGEAEARSAAAAALESVDVPAAAASSSALPREWSGGMRQRALIAMALAHDPELLIADEPTTALDVTVQARILELLRQSATGDRGLLLITHDLGVIAELADRVAVMHAGRIVETGPVARIFDAPDDPYTIELLASRPGVSAAPASTRSAASATPRVQEPARIAPPEGASGVPALRADGLTTVYRGARAGRDVRAVEELSLSIAAGEIVGLVGESGCGKSTLARTLVGLDTPEAGRVELAGIPIVEPGRRARPGHEARRRIQMVFQGPLSSLNPRRSAGDTVAQALRIRGRLDASGWDSVYGLLDRVGLSAAQAESFPHELSGGQRQRVSIARALAAEPDVLVLDEPLTALDVAVQMRILALLAELRADLGVAMLLIAHDLAVVREVADRIAVMYLGRIVEQGPTGVVFGDPAHPYTHALISAVPAAHPRDSRLGRRVVLDGEVPDAASPPSGCAFHPRCPRARPRCAAHRPALEPAPTSSDRPFACFHPMIGPPAESD